MSLILSTFNNHLLYSRPCVRCSRHRHCPPKNSQRWDKQAIPLGLKSKKRFISHGSFPQGIYSRLMGRRKSWAQTEPMINTQDVGGECQIQKLMARTLETTTAQVEVREWAKVPESRMCQLYKRHGEESIWISLPGSANNPHHLASTFTPVLHLIFPGSSPFVHHFEKGPRRSFWLLFRLLMSPAQCTSCIVLHTVPWK